MAQTVKGICEDATKKLVKVRDKHNKEANNERARARDLRQQAESADKLASGHNDEAKAANTAIDNFKALFGIK